MRSPPEFDELAGGARALWFWSLCFPFSKGIQALRGVLKKEYEYDCSPFSPLFPIKPRAINEKSLRLSKLAL